MRLPMPTAAPRPTNAPNAPNSEIVYIVCELSRHPHMRAYASYFWEAVRRDLIEPPDEP